MKNPRRIGWWLSAALVAMVSACGSESTEEPGIIVNPPDSMTDEGGQDPIDASADTSNPDDEDADPADAADTDVDAEDGGGDAAGEDAQDAGGEAVDAEPDSAEPDSGEGADVEDDADGGEDAGGEEGGPVLDYAECDAGNVAWAKRTIEVLLGRKPHSANEVRVLADMVEATDRATVARGLMDADGYYRRWAIWLMDELRVNRVGIKKHEGCFGDRLRPEDQGEVAAYIRDSEASSSQGLYNFNMTDVLYSSLELDDLSPLYRAYLFAMMAKPIDGANVGEIEMDITRRQDFGEIFSAIYTNRNVACTGCHNAEYSTTDHPDPELDRFWPVPALLEKGIYGNSAGRPEMEVYAMFRHMDVVTSQASGLRPWSMAPNCGRFRTTDQLPQDPVQANAFFIEQRGLTGNIWQVEAALAEGFEMLRADGLQVDPQTLEVDGKEAFAYMVCARIADRVWREVHGYPLTLVHYFPRNQAQQEILIQLTNVFVESDFSLRALLAEVLAHPLYNQKPPADGCGVSESPYMFPAVFNPWVIEEPVEIERFNSVGDALHRFNARVMLNMIESALEWPPHPQFTNDTSADEEFQKAIGAFVKDAEPGFSGVDFQGMLSWENKYGACKSPFGSSGGPVTPGDASCVGHCGGQAPSQCWCDDQCKDFGDCCSDKVQVCDEGGGGAPDPEPEPNPGDCLTGYGSDYIAKMICHAKTVGETTVTLRQLVEAMKDRLVTEPIVWADGEEALVAAFFDVDSVDKPLAEVTGWTSRVRNFCGVLVESPHFLVNGSTVSTLPESHALQVPGTTYNELCTAMASAVLPPEEWIVTCDTDSVVIQPASSEP
jgi:hypothetical protein